MGAPRSPGTCSIRCSPRYSRFAGRADVLATVQQFIDSPGSGYLAITAPAGYGKTALATRIIDRNRDVAAYHFFTTLYGSNAASEFLSELFFVKNATEQMRLWSFFPYDDRTAPTTLSEWVTASCLSTRVRNDSTQRETCARARWTRRGQGVDAASLSDVASCRQPESHPHHPRRAWVKPG